MIFRMIIESKAWKIEIKTFKIFEKFQNNCTHLADKSFRRTAWTLETVRPIAGCPVGWWSAERRGRSRSSAPCTWSSFDIAQCSRLIGECPAASSWTRRRMWARSRWLARTSGGHPNKTNLQGEKKVLMVSFAKLPMSRRQFVVQIRRFEVMLEFKF